PVTFGSTILLPPHYRDWDVRKRQAVLAHEGAHVANRDFHVLLLASLNRAVFWFSPFAWWHLAQLAELAEVISDARAVEVVEDRCSYAEIL
ncbi:M56 family metallopeptidase, partial [Acinetobacter baumannii]